MPSSNLSVGYSAHVQLELRVGGLRFPLAQIGGDRLVFDKPVVLPGTTGEVRARIDEHEERFAATWPASALPRDVLRAELRFLG